MGNKQKSVKRAKKRPYRERQQHMMEVIKKKRLTENQTTVDQSATGEPLSTSTNFQKLQNVIHEETSGPSGITLISPPTQHFKVTTNVRSQKLEESDNVPDLEIEANYHQEQETHIGRRIISVSHFYKKLKDISDHGPLGCSMSHIDLVSEKINGLTSKFTFMCRLCNSKFTIDSDSNDDHYLPVNSCAVAGIISIGGGHSQLQELSSALNLPLITSAKYQTIHERLSKNWEDVAQETMNQAAKKERDLAIAEGRLSKDGIPIIDVCVDGCYSKRSYKKNYSALSGAAAIIGMRSGQILFLGVRNKYCYTCDRAEKMKTAVREHKCFKNYTGPSTGMESDIIVEGFKQSIETHNLIYKRLISDGDSSTYNKILQAHPYKGITVEKIECRNHLLRNFCNKLQALQTDTRYPIKQRKVLTSATIMTMRSVIKKSIAKNKSDKSPDVQKLFDDIILSHYHAFGKHTSCKSFFCEKNGEKGSTPDDFFVSSLWQRICLIVQNIASHARSLIHDVDSNIVERYHSIVAKYVGGKRINFSLKQSYATRCKAAAVSFNTDRSLSRLYKNITKQSPRGQLKMLEKRRVKQKQMNTKYLKKKRRIIFKKSDENYGENCKKPDMPEEVLEEMKRNFVKSLKKTQEERDLIQKKTILQRDCSEWMELRRSLLTASNFGRVIKKKDNTPCANLVKDILYKSNLDHVSSIKHGHHNEKTAIMQLACQEGINIESCGLFIDEDLPFLGATPDGISGEDTIVEIKCPITAYKLGLNEAIARKKVNFWIRSKEGKLKINKNHNWFYQIQGQLHVTKREKCIFAVWSGESEILKTEIIKKDDMFWHNSMQAKLESFYMNCLLPEIVDPRFTRNLSIREPNRPNETNIQMEQNITTLSEISEDEDKSNVSPSSTVNKNQCQPSCSRYLCFDEY